MKYPAIIVLALVLLATVVTGREREPAPQPVRASYAPALEVAPLARERRETEIEDIFGVPPVLPAVVPKAEPAPAPTTPPLPFSYLGRMKKGERTTLYLLRNQDMVIVEEGATLESAYRVERISDTTAHFVYLPLGTAQTLAIPPVP